MRISDWSSDVCSSDLVGTLGPDEAVVIAPEIAGRIDRINFAEGDEVDAGDVLVELDATILRAELVKARSDLTLAEANRERAMTLAQRGTGTLRARDEAVAAYQAAQAHVTRSEEHTSELQSLMRSSYAVF